MITDKTVPMTRLNYTLPEWTRVIWSSEKARQAWEPRIRNAANAWIEAEERSVEMGFREFALINIDEAALVEKTLHYAKKGIHIIPLSRQNKSATYTSSSQSYDPSKPSNLRVVLTKQTALIPEWIKAWETQDNQTIGRFLGFPECCVKFFEETWVKQNFLDTTWPMYQNTEKVGDIGCNILLRWMGIRLVSHLPCSFGCKSSIKIATKNAILMDQLGFGDYANDIISLLRMPVEWSAKHGIAEIKTPLFKVSTRTDATSDLYVIQRSGEFYPPEGASGTKFPYRNEQKNLLSLSKSFKKSLEIVDPTLEWKDNGFSSKEAMSQMHDKVLTALKEAGIGSAPNGYTVVDLGCGNGKLLNKIAILNDRLSLNGVEKNLEVARRGQFASTEAVIYNNDIFDGKWCEGVPQPFDLGIISINRLLENPQTLRWSWEYLFTHFKNLFVYSYDLLDSDNMLSSLPFDKKYTKLSFGFFIRGNP